MSSLSPEELAFEEQRMKRLEEWDRKQRAQQDKYNAEAEARRVKAAEEFRDAVQAISQLKLEGKR